MMIVGSGVGLDEIGGVRLRETYWLNVNGVDVAVEAERNTPLLYVLRNELGLTGTRFGCGEGICGSCTVVVDGLAVYSCDVPIWDVANKAVTTIEGLSVGGNMHPLQRAMLAEQAGQCGYCLSGIIMRAKALLDETPTPTREQIVAALDKNLCRCGVHNRVIRAVERAAGELAGPAPA